MKATLVACKICYFRKQRYIEKKCFMISFDKLGQSKLLGFCVCIFYNKQWVFISCWWLSLVSLHSLSCTNHIWKWTRPFLWYWTNVWIKVNYLWSTSVKQFFRNERLNVMLLHNWLCSLEISVLFLKHQRVLVMRVTSHALKPHWFGPIWQTLYSCNLNADIWVSNPS